MATWLRSAEGAVCPKNGEKIKSGGGKYEPYPTPCTGCEHLGGSYCGAWRATIQCKFKGGR